jgi:hypothetical protein
MKQVFGKNVWKIYKAKLGSQMKEQRNLETNTQNKNN